MKKILFIIIFSILINPLYAGPKDKVKKNGFISKKNIHPIKNDFNISDPKNKIILIYNHGQNENDMALQSCAWVSMLRNHASLIDQEVNGKKIMVYNLCSDHLRGDMSQEKNWWNLKPKPQVYMKNLPIVYCLVLYINFLEAKATEEVKVSTAELK